MITKLSNAMLCACLYIVYFALNILELPFRTYRHTLKGFNKHFIKSYPVTHKY